MTRFLAALAFMAFAFGGMLVVAAEKNHKWWLRRQEQLPRFQRVRARVLDSGIRSSDGRRWIRFTCRVGGADVDSSRVSSSGAEANWEGFEKGREYDAFHDPVLGECVLLVDEEVQAVNPELRASREAALWFSGFGAAFGLLAAGLAVAGRRSASPPPGA